MRFIGHNRNSLTTLSRLEDIREFLLSKEIYCTQDNNEGKLTHSYLGMSLTSVAMRVE